MAKEDASVAIQNALQKLDKQPSLVHDDKTLKSLKSNLHRVGTSLDRFNNSIPKLTEVKEIAYDVQDAMDNAAMVDAAAKAAAQQRWRNLGNLFLFLSQSDKINQQSIDDQIKALHKRTVSVGAFDGEEVVVEIQIPPKKDLLKLFYFSLSGFPAGVEISARRLIQIWVAEGFLDGSTAMEDQGREEIKRLLDRGFITQVEIRTCGELKTFKIEADKLEACRSAAEEEKFVHVSAGEDDETSRVEATRLAIHSQSTSLLNGDNLRRFADLSKVRSLQIHCNNRSDRPMSDFAFLIPRKKEFESLWVLDLGCLELETVPEVIGKLTHLRYLRLRAPKATKIPASICNLRNLQTIDLKEAKRLKAMPVEIWKTKTNLQHLHLGGATALPPPCGANHYDALQNLQSLCGVRPDKELKRLMVRAKFPNVNRLRLHTSKKESVTSKREFLSFLNSLDLLYRLRSLTLEGPIGDLPADWNAFPSSLTKMTLLKTGIQVENCVKTLQNLPSLRYLKLMEDSVAGEEMRFAGGGFPALEVLRMEGLKDLECWRVEKDAVRLLRELKVGGCDKFRRVEAFQPSKKLEETLQKLQSEHEHIKVYSPVAIVE